MIQDAVASPTPAGHPTTQQTSAIASRPRLHLASMDVLRGVAALMVLVHHAYGFFWRTAVETPTYSAADVFQQFGVAGGTGFVFSFPAWAGVNLFFIISGFCIHLPYAQRNTTPRLASYATRRFFRLYPTYLVAIGLGFALAGLRSGSNGVVSLSNLLGHLVFWYYADGQWSPSTAVSPVLWTISLEVQFYVLYLIVRRFLWGAGIARLTILFLTGDVLWHIFCAIAEAQGHPLPASLVPRDFAIFRFGEWLLGAWLAEIVLRRHSHGLAQSPDTSRWTRTPVLVAIGTSLLLAGTAIPWLLRTDRYLPDPLLSMGFFLLAWAMVDREQRVIQSERRHIAIRILALAGERCYSIYLFHFAIFACVGEAYIRTRYHSQVSKNALGGGLEWGAVTLAAIVIAFAVIEVVYRSIEVPSHRLARKLANRLEVRERGAKQPHAA
jgi:peptidoglycan/LPS O-acetylase OafA/YrhL